jgi:hypothetical protein
VVSGPNAKVVRRVARSLSDEAVQALRAGDIDALIEVNRREFGGFRMEADGDGDKDGDKDDDGKNDKDDDTDSGGDDGDDDDGNSSGDGDDDTVSKADLERMEKRMKAADKRAADAEKRLKEIDDAKKGDLEKAQDKVTELETENTTLRESLQSERLNNAFLSANKHTWHKPSAALKLAQSEGFLDGVVGEDGTVDNKALSSALDKLAKEHDYLTKPREGAGASGESGNGRSGNSKDDKATKTQDRRRAPALRNRG